MTAWRTPALGAFAWVVPVTQRHTVDQRRFQADLRYGAGWTALLEADGWLAKVLVGLPHRHLMPERDMQMRTVARSLAMYTYTVGLIVWSGATRTAERSTPRRLLRYTRSSAVLYWVG